MVKVEAVITSGRWELNILEREDATEEERKHAKAIEDVFVHVWEYLSKRNPEYGMTITRIE